MMFELTVIKYSGVWAGTAHVTHLAGRGLFFFGCFETRSDYASETGCNLLQPTHLSTQVLGPQAQVR